MQQLNFASPIFPFFERSQPQLSRSPRLQFLVRVYMTPAALIACTKEVSLVAVKERKFTKPILIIICYTFILIRFLFYFDACNLVFLLGDIMRILRMDMFQH